MIGKLPKGWEFRRLGEVTVYCHRFFRPLSKPRLCYNTILLKGASDGETQTKKIYPRV